MGLKTVILRTAATVLPFHHWFPAGTEVQIPEEHFDPEFHTEVAPAAGEPAPAPVLEDATPSEAAVTAEQAAADQPP